MSSSSINNIPRFDSENNSSGESEYEDASEFIERNIKDEYIEEKLDLVVSSLSATHTNSEINNIKKKKNNEKGKKYVGKATSKDKKKEKYNSNIQKDNSNTETINNEYGYSRGMPGIYWDDIYCMISSLHDENAAKECVVSVQQNLLQANLRNFPPKAYEDGNFWIDEKDLYFTLQEKNDKNKFDDDEMKEESVVYKPRIFLWYPHYLHSKLHCPKCREVFSRVTYSGKSFIFKVLDINDCYYMLTCCYACNTCRSTTKSTDNRIITQLPLNAQLELPAILNMKYGVSRSLVDFAQTLLHTPTSVEILSILKNLHNKRLDMLQLMQQASQSTTDQYLLPEKKSTTAESTNKVARVPYKKKLPQPAETAEKSESSTSTHTPPTASQMPPEQFQTAGPGDQRFVSPPQYQYYMPNNSSHQQQFPFHSPPQYMMNPYIQYFVPSPAGGYYVPPHPPLPHFSGYQVPPQPSQPPQPGPSHFNGYQVPQPLQQELPHFSGYQVPQKSSQQRPSHFSGYQVPLQPSQQSQPLQPSHPPQLISGTPSTFMPYKHPEQNVPPPPAVRNNPSPQPKKRQKTKETP